MTTGRVLTYMVLIGGAAVSLIPFVYMIMTALKTYGSVINDTFWPWPPFGNEMPQFQNIAEAIRTIGWDNSWHTFLFVRYLGNSVIVAAATIAGVLITSTCAAYVFARIDVPGKNVLFMLFLATLMIPNDLVLVPKVVMIYDLNWYNTYRALTIPFMVSAFAIFLLRQFFLQVPKDLFDAAVVDGAGHLRCLISIMIPLSKPALLTIGLLTFIGAWDDFKWPLLVTRDQNMRVLAVGLQQFMQGEGGTNTQLLMAFAALVVAPVIVLYLFTQRYFTEGIAMTGIKG
jgi:ABC-type glycerol-3-phosphate transport system permease component